MTSIADMLGRVMMTAVKLPRSTKENKADYRTWALTEYRQDAQYAYECMVAGKSIDLR